MHKKESSYGIIPLRKEKGKWQTLLVKHGKGHWSFPKGHSERGEEPTQTAERELEEETGLQVALYLNIPPQHEHYFFRQGSDLINKSVTYFVAEVTGQITLQQAEIADFKWLSLEEAEELATFAEAKKVCSTIQEYLKSI